MPKLSSRVSPLLGSKKCVKMISCLSSNNTYVYSKHVAGSHQSAIHTDRHHHSYLSSKILHLSRYKNVIKTCFKMKNVPYQLFSGIFSSTAPIMNFTNHNISKRCSNPATAHLRIQVSLHHQHVSSTPWGKNMTRDTKMLASGNWAQKHHVWCIHWEVSGALQNPPKHAVGGALLSKVYVCMYIWIYIPRPGIEGCMYMVDCPEIHCFYWKELGYLPAIFGVRVFPRICAGILQICPHSTVLPASKFTEIMEASNGRSQR